MRYIRIVDFAIQTLLMIPALTIGLFQALKNDPGTLLCVQFLMGCWQMGGSFISIVVRGPYFEHKIRHFIISLLYLASLTIFVGNPGEGIPAMFYLTIPPWVLAGYYYFLTYRRLIARTPNGKFLPHLNF